MTNRATSRRRKNQRGSEMVETALVFIALLSMLMFIMEMGRILMMQQYLTERARETARAAVVNNWTSDQTKNYLVYASTTAPSGGGAGYLGLQTSQVAYSALGTAGNSDYRLQVKISGVPVLTWLPYIAGQYTLAPITATMAAQSLGATN